MTDAPSMIQSKLGPLCSSLSHQPLCFLCWTLKFSFHRYLEIYVFNVTRHYLFIHLFNVTWHLLNVMSPGGKQCASCPWSHSQYTQGLRPRRHIGSICWMNQWMNEWTGKCWWAGDCFQKEKTFHGKTLPRPTTVVIPSLWLPSPEFSLLAEAFPVPYPHLPIPVVLRFRLMSMGNSPALPSLPCWPTVLGGDLGIQWTLSTNPQVACGWEPHFLAVLIYSHQSSTSQCTHTLEVWVLRSIPLVGQCGQPSSLAQAAGLLLGIKWDCAEADD